MIVCSSEVSTYPHSSPLDALNFECHLRAAALGCVNHFSWCSTKILRGLSTESFSSRSIAVESQSFSIGPGAVILSLLRILVIFSCFEMPLAASCQLMGEFSVLLTVS